MKNNIYKRLISISLLIAVLATSFYAGTPVSVYGAVPDSGWKFDSDNFADSEFSGEVWGTYKSNTTESMKFEDGKMYLPATKDIVNPRDVQGITRIKDDYLPSGRLRKVEITAFTGNDSGRGFSMYPVYWDTGSEQLYGWIEMAYNANRTVPPSGGTPTTVYGVPYAQTGVTGTGITGSNWNSAWTAYSNEDTDKPVSVTFEYDYSNFHDGVSANNKSITVIINCKTFSGTDFSWNNNITKIFTYRFTDEAYNKIKSERMYFGFGGATTTNPITKAKTSQVLSVKADFEMTADLFESKHSVFLNTALNSVSSANKAQLKLVLDDYKTISDAEKANITTDSQTKLDALAAKILGRFKQDDFNDPEWSELVWVSDNKGVPADLKASSISDGVLNVPLRAGTDSKNTIYHVYGPLITAGRIKKLEMKAKLTNPSSGWSGFFVFPAYWGQDAYAGLDLSVQSGKDGTGTTVNSYGMRSHLYNASTSQTVTEGISPGTFNQFGRDSSNVFYDMSGQTLTLTFAYDYSNFNSTARRLIVSVTAIDEQGRFVSNGVNLILDFTAEVYESVKDRQMLFGFSSASVTGVTMDSVKILDKEMTGSEIPEDFRMNHEDILSESTATVTSAKTSALIAAFNEYYALDSESKSELAPEYSLIISLALKLSSEFTAWYNSYKDLLTTHNNALNHEAYDDILENALNAYNAFTDNLAKAAADKLRLDEIALLLADMLYSRGSNYEPLVINFDDEPLIPFKAMVPHSAKSTLSVVPNPTPYEGEKQNNNVLKIDSDPSDTIMYLVDPLAWPTRGQMTKVRWKALVPNATPNSFIWDWNNTENFGGTNLLNESGTRRFELVDGSLNYPYGTTVAPPTELRRPGDWLNLEAVFSGNDITISVWYDDSEDLVYKGTQKNFRPGSRFGFYRTPGSVRAVYVDEIVIEFMQGPGDFDVDEDIVDVIPYYTGNTFVSPGETVLISGELLGIVADKVYVKRMPDEAVPAWVSASPNPNAIPKYLEESKYNANGQRYSHYTKDIDMYTDPSLYTGAFTALDEETVIQRTKTGIKFIMPDDGKGIYAVKITSKLGGRDAYVYINRPDINFVMGDEGDLATRGGSVRAIGSNLTPTANSNDVRMQLVGKKPNGDIIRYDLPNLKIYGDPNNEETKNEDPDMYSVEAYDIPNDIPDGVYEVFVHNGYGGYGAWSMPGTIKIGPGPRDLWPQDVFNIKTFGAVGDKFSNDTPAFIDAMEALRANGGGILYLPAGMYRLNNTLPVPEHVSIRGDGSGSSSLLFSADTWQYNEAKSLFSLIGNVELRDFDVHALRSKHMFVVKHFVTPPHAGVIYSEDYQGSRNDNIYLINMRWRKLHMEGIATGVETYSGMQHFVRKYTTIQHLQSVLQYENNRAAYYNMSTALNQQMINIDVFLTESLAASPDTMNIVSHNTFSVTKDCNFRIGFGVMLGQGMYHIFENSFIDGGNFYGSGTGCYYARSGARMTHQNSREMFLEDGTDLALNQKIIQALDKDSSGRTYRLISSIGATPPAVNTLMGQCMCIYGNQGMGQIRRIVANSIEMEDGANYFDKGNLTYWNANGTSKNVRIPIGYIKFDSPFAVQPNRNSILSRTRARDSLFLINCHFQDGNIVGTYGGRFNGVWDGITMDAMGSNCLIPMGSRIWYNTYQNWNCINPQMVHNDGWGNGVTVVRQPGKSQLEIASSAAGAPFAIACIVWRNNKFNQYGIKMSPGSPTDSTVDIIMEKNVVKDVDYAIEYMGGYTSYYINTINGFLVRENDFDVDSPNIFNISIINDAMKNGGNSPTINNQGSPRVMVQLKDYAADVLGDVNGDGRLTLKDVTLLRYWLVGLIELDEKSLARARTSGGTGDPRLKDVNTIRKWIIES